MNSDGIILIAKQPGPTSFVTLHSIKKALNTTKVGHTGTLDSFAQGLLIACTGRLTRLSGNITEFNKTYKAIIKFGEETDTLEYTGNIIKKSALPKKEQVIEAVNHFTGIQKQIPPLFSAIHIDGQRSSDLMRSGIKTNLPSRTITVYSSQIIEIKTNNNQEVQYIHIEFNVSKGTYIRSLARDIGEYCNSSAHLIGLYRTKIGNFKIEDAAGFSKLPYFNIETSIKIMEEQKIIIQKNKEKEDLRKKERITKEKFIPTEEELEFQNEIRAKKQTFKEDSALLCGFKIIHITNRQASIDFENGRNLHSKNFDIKLYDLPRNSLIAVFNDLNDFAGILEKDIEGKIHYKLVIN